MSQTFNKYLCWCILVFSKTQQEHVEPISKALKVLRTNNFYTRLSKCQFAKEGYHYLDHVVGKHGIKIDPKKFKPSRVGLGLLVLAKEDHCHVFVVIYGVSSKVV